MKSSAFIFILILTLATVGLAQKTVEKSTNTVIKKKDSKPPTKFYEEAGSFDADEDIMTMDETNLQYLVTASSFADQGNYPKAIETLSKAVERDPKFTSGYLNRSYYYFLTGQISLAIKDLTQIISLGKGSPDVYYNRGLLYLQNGDYKLAVEDLSQAITLSPKAVQAYQLRAIAYRKLGKIAKAKADEKRTKELAKD
jgi:tetratricopeptide (TPR) repeat protein